METIGAINRSVEILLRICGLWTGSPYAPFCKLYWTFSFSITIILSFQYIIKYLQDTDLPELMETFSVFVVNILVFCKLVIFWLNQRTLDELLAIMAMDWKKNIDTDLNAHIMAKKANLSRYFSNTLVVIYSGSVLAYSIVILATNIFSNESSERSLLIKMNLPFDSNRQFVHEFVMLNQLFQLLMLASADAILNALLITMVLHASGQIKILCGWLIKIFPKKEKYNLQITMVEKIITRHQDIIAFSKKIEKLYSYIALVQFLSDTLLICGLGFILATSIGKPNTWVILIKTCLFYFSMNLEAFTFCFAGEYLSTESKTIGDAAYNSLWYESTSKDTQIILFLIMRSQNQLTITIGKITDMSLKRFSDIVKASASYISVLLAMY
ncbi:ObirOr5-V9 [Ooceraea biroi]|uniref:Odorant receptor n=1 Tax=Ooceraea biroi TaxID=2015173 RepID=A0A3L8DWU4_OOCBI|nr:odorant receptor 4-like isoform X1 [Ooceraea biroi]RLU24846.1 ObirOr5-V9 [Ooceraea biroi]